MKIALTTSGNDLTSTLDLRFGRAPKFVVYDLTNDTFEIIDNTQNLNLPGGAGIQSGQNIARTGAEAVITGHMGPKAFQTLQAADIKIYLKNGGTIKEAIEDFKNNKLTEANNADKEGHWI